MRYTPAGVVGSGKPIVKTSNEGPPIGGITDPGELLSLADAGIASTALASTTVPEKIGQNVVTTKGTFTRTDGTTGKIPDVAFGLNNFYSVYRGSTAVSDQAAPLLELKVRGTLAGLRVAMTLSKDSEETDGVALSAEPAALAA